MTRPRNNVPSERCQYGGASAQVRRNPVEGCAGERVYGVARLVRACARTYVHSYDGMRGWYAQLFEMSGGAEMLGQ